MEDSTTDTLLQLNNISVVYSDVIQVLKGVSLNVQRGRIVSLLGSNGAGKTTTLKAISGLLKPENGKVTDGNIIYAGELVQNLSPEELTRLGIIQVLEGRQPFKYLTIEENLKVGHGNTLDQALQEGPGSCIWLLPCPDETQKGPGRLLQRGRTPDGGYGQGTHGPPQAAPLR